MPAGLTITIDKLQGLFKLRDAGHGCFGREAAALQLPFLPLLQQLTDHQPQNRRVVGKDADHVGAACDRLVKPHDRVGAPDLAQALLGRVK